MMRFITLKIMINVMKIKILQVLFFILPVVTFFGCSGKEDEMDNVDPNSIIISADKRKIQANGVDAISVTVKKGNSDITSLSQIMIIKENETSAAERC